LPFTDRLVLTRAQLSELDLSGSVVPGVDAEKLRVTGDLVLASGFRARGRIDLSDADIGGTLDCRGGRLSAADLSGMAVRGDVLFSTDVKG
jgi:uncharacterized protein YjbI with pentapeptide repeats